MKQMEDIGEPENPGFFRRYLRPELKTSFNPINLTHQPLRRPVRPKPHRLVIGLPPRIIRADAGIDILEPGRFGCQQRCTKQARADALAGSRRADMRADDAPAFFDAIWVIGSRIGQRLKAENSAFTVFRDRALDVVFPLEIDFEDRLYIPRRLSQTGRENLVLHGRHCRCVIQCCGADFQHRIKT